MQKKLAVILGVIILITAGVGLFQRVLANQCDPEVGFVSGPKLDPKTGLLVFAEIPGSTCEKKQLTTGFLSGVRPDPNPLPAAEIFLQTARAPIGIPRAPVRIPSTPSKIRPKAKITAASTTKMRGLNLNKLSMAVAMQETHNCKDRAGSALLNNCHGFRINGKYLSFNSAAESHAYFKKLWSTSYKRFPDLYLAKIYSGNDKPVQWLRNVTYYYYNL